MRPETAVTYYRKVWDETLLANLKIETIRKVITVPVPEHWELLTVPFEEYADYRSMNNFISETCINEDAVQKVKDLANGCATLYNVLVENAVRKHEHKVVFDLFTNNLKFNFVINDQPSVADPLALLGGWASFRFRFAHSNDVKDFFHIKQETLSRLEAL